MLNTYRKILGKLWEHKLYAKASKCEFLKTLVEFLGQQICRGGITPIEAKLKAVQDWATPRRCSRRKVLLEGLHELLSDGLSQGSTIAMRRPLERIV